MIQAQSDSGSISRPVLRISALDLSLTYWVKTVTKAAAAALMENTLASYNSCCCSFHWKERTPIMETSNGFHFRFGWVLFDSSTRKNKGVNADRMVKVRNENTYIGTTERKWVCGAVCLFSTQEHSVHAFGGPAGDQMQSKKPRYLILESNGARRTF